MTNINTKFITKQSVKALAFIVQQTFSKFTPPLPRTNTKHSKGTNLANVNKEDSAS